MCVSKSEKNKIRSWYKHVITAVENHTWNTNSFSTVVHNNKICAHENSQSVKLTNHKIIIKTHGNVVAKKTRVTKRTKLQPVGDKFLARTNYHSYAVESHEKLNILIVFSG